MSARGFGGLRDVGNYGYSWSSTIPAESGNAHYLDFNYDGVYPQRSNYRAYGLQLRCLQEKGGRAADFTLEPGGLSVRENLLRLACGAVELWGLNESLSSSPLRPRWPLLSVMRQKVGKERSQGDCHPLGHPPLLPELGRNNSSKTPRGRVALPPGIEGCRSAREGRTSL